MLHAALAKVESALKETGLSYQVIDGILQIVRAHVGEPIAGKPRSSNESQTASPPPDTVAGVARQFLRDSLRRTEVVGTKVEDPGWNMMLAIFADAAEGERTSVTSACHASGVPLTTALRHVERLRLDGLIHRRQDPHDSRRALLMPTGRAMQNMEVMVRQFCIPPPPPTPAAVVIATN